MSFCANQLYLPGDVRCDRCKEPVKRGVVVISSITHAIRKDEPRHRASLCPACGKKLGEWLANPEAP